MSTFASLFIVLLMLSTHVHADTSKPSLPVDGAIRSDMVYASNQSYTVLTQALYPTTIEFAEDEKVVWVEKGDEIAWRYTQLNDRYLFVQPRMANISTAISVITSKRSYQLKLLSGPGGGKWDQKVSWIYPDIIAAQKAMADAGKKAATDRIKAADFALVPGSPSLDSMNSNYKVSGAAQYKDAITAMDDGNRTWIRLPYIERGKPEIFLRSQDGDRPVANFSMKNNFAILGMVSSAWVVRIGRELVLLEKQQ